jgi:hypothetical protein
MKSSYENQTLQGVARGFQVKNIIDRMPFVEKHAQIGQNAI